MSGPAYIPLFPADYMADTTHLSTEEHGAYMLLLMAAWMQDDCSLPDDDRKLSRICRLSLRKWCAIKATIQDFWIVEDGRWKNRRLTKERVYADKKSEANRENASKRWRKQPIEKQQSGSCERSSDGYAPQPQPHSNTLSSDEDNAQPAENPPVETPAAKPAFDPGKVVFDAALPILTDAGRNERQARSIIAKWRAQHSDGRIIDAIIRCRERPPVEPVSWITQQLTHNPSTTTRQPTHERHHNAAADEPVNPTVRAAARRAAERAAGVG